MSETKAPLLEKEISLPVKVKWTSQKVTVELGDVLVPVHPNSENTKRDISVSNIKTETGPNGPVITFDAEVGGNQYRSV